MTMASFGENLRRERELRGIDLREIAQATKISVRFLQALETDHIDQLPGGIFRRSFVREYARYVGLDADRLVSEFLHVYGEPSTPAPASPSSKPRRSYPFYRRIFFGLVVLVACGVSAYVARRPTATAAPATTSASPVLVFPQDQLLPQVSSVAEAGPVASGPLLLELRATESCWVGAEVDGQIVLNRVLSGGETRTLSATERIVLSVGNAGAIALRINDHPGLALGRPGEVRRNIVITKQSVPSLVEDRAPSRTAHSG